MPSVAVLAPLDCNRLQFLETPKDAAIKVLGLELNEKTSTDGYYIYVHVT